MNRAWLSRGRVPLITTFTWARGLKGGVLGITDSVLGVLHPGACTESFRDSHYSVPQAPGGSNVSLVTLGSARFDGL